MSEECTVVIPGEPIIELTENGLEGFEVLCRLCANRSDHLIAIYSEEGISNGLAEKMNLYLPVKVAKSDALPLQCCYQCASTVLTWHELVVASVETDRRLRSIQDEVDKQLAAHVEPGPSQVDLEKPERCAVPVNSLTDLVLKAEHPVPADNLSFTTYLCNIRNRNPLRNDSETSIGTQRVVTVDGSIDNHPAAKSSENQVTNDQAHAELSVNQPVRIKLREPYESDRGLRVKRERKAGKNVEKHTVDAQANDHDSTSSAPAVQTEPPVRRTYQCAQCQRHFFQKLSLERHTRIHRDERPCTCDVCGKGFRDKSGLTRHINHVHGRLKRFPCDVCAQRFASGATRDDHRRTHTKERPYVCQACGKSFSCKATLYIHAKTHTDVFPFECSVCAKRFRRRQELVAHASTHTGARPYSCTECDKCFRRKDSLASHRLVHTDVKPFECKECGVRYRQARYLKNHVNVKHRRTKTE